MGLFGKKKQTTAASGTGEYVAPAIAQQQSPPRTANLVQGDGQDIELAKAASKAITATAAPNIDIEEGAADSKSESLVPGSVLGQDQTTVNDLQPTVYDEGTVFTKGAETIQTFQTLKSIDSAESKDSAFTITRNGQYLTLNGFANGHLMRWKFAAEEGPAIIRIPAVIAALGVIGTTVYPLILFPEFWTFPVLICAFHVIVLASLILILEGRVLGGIRSPTNFRARVRGVVTRYINLFRLLWGRGLLYIFVGSMNMTIDFDKVIFSGVPLMVLGVFAIGSGAHASYNLDRMKSSLTDESYLWERFEACDSDLDTFLDLNGFADLLWSLGLEFDDVYTYKAFQQIDKDNDSKVSFDEFKHWWIVTQNDGRKLRKA